MKNFDYIRVSSLEEASELLRSCPGKACVKAGGTDLIGALKRNIHPDYPELVIDILSVEGCSYILEEEGFVRIGALTTLKEVAANAMLREKYTVLAEAAERTASPNLRCMGTIGGNICQENRCWYYRAKDNFFPCKMKGGKMCYAPAGDNRIHSVLGAVNGCFAVNPSDTAPAILALGGIIVTTDREIPAEDFWTASCTGCTILEKSELVKEIRFPAREGLKSAFLKHALRPTIDFPIINCAVVNDNGQYVVALNGVYPKPYRAFGTEEYISNRELTEENAEAAAEQAFGKIIKLSKNEHKLKIAKAYIKTLLLKTAQ